MPNEPMIIVCRSITNYDLWGHTIPTSHIITSCTLCKIDVAVGLAGQAAMATSKTYILCSLCVKELAQRLKDLEVTDIILSPEITEQINKNPDVAKSFENLQKTLKSKEK